jgi:flavin reductase (DIM6/NTAB) family NADH-FMN oxidoreductase RutF
MAKFRFATPRISLFPKPVVVVTSINNRDEVGATTIAWTGIISSRPPVISVSFLPDSFTRSCIIESRDFVINVPSGHQWNEVNLLGARSGNWISKMDLLKAKNYEILQLSPSADIRSPKIDNFFLNIECRVLNTVQCGLYDCFLGQVLTMWCDESLYKDDHPKGNILYGEVWPLFCLGDQYWSRQGALGVSTENKAHPHGSEH